jgi:(p)ppGpp synthase/HD superfamily hydrolase
MDDLTTLRNLTLAPYLLKATALIGVRRLTGGNQFRHGFATLGILFDYKYYNNPVLLKASLLHDIVEELNVDVNEIKNIDSDGPEVVNLIFEVSRNKEEETKEEYLERLRHASTNAKILKCADRISNITDLHLDTHTDSKISSYLDQTENYILPLAKEVNINFEIELRDLIIKRRKLCEK